MPLTGYLKIDDIPGESQRADHEDEIDIHELSWGVERASGASIGRGRRRARAEVSPLTLRKYVDRASVYLAQATARGTAFDEMVLSVRKDSGEAHLDYLVITMENVVISSYDVTSDLDDASGQLLVEEIDLEFERVTLKYTQQADDHSAGEEAEVTIDT